MESEAEARPFGWPEGPYVNAALFCERVIEEKDGVLTPVRIVDRVVTLASGTGTPSEMPVTTINLTFLVVLKSGAAMGRHECRLEVEDPRGLRRPFGPALSVQMEGAERGHNLLFPMAWQVEIEGLYWVTVAIDDRPVTRVPLRVMYQRAEAGGLLAGGG